MAKDLIIGGTSRYTWDQLKYWINSIHKSGFDGDIVLVAGDIDKRTIDKLVSKGVTLSVHGTEDSQGNYTSKNKLAPHVERFFYIWNILDQIEEGKYDRVITTDTRDVIFQYNPSKWLDENLNDKKIVCSSEGLKYKNEPWGDKNLLDTFGPYFHEYLRENMIYNVGTIAGDFEYVKDLMLMIFQICVSKQSPITDQAVFNYLIAQQPYKGVIKNTSNVDGWAIQLGTTIESVKSGHGEIGVQAVNDENVMLKYQKDYEDIQPYIKDDSVLVDENGKEFCIVHQYDRVPSLNSKIMEKFND